LFFQVTSSVNLLFKSFLKTWTTPNLEQAFHNIQVLFCKFPHTFFGGFHKATRIDYPLREFLKVQTTKLQPVSDLQLVTLDRDKNLLGTGNWIESITALITIPNLKRKAYNKAQGARALLK
jgi:hypothetical protein